MAASLYNSILMTFLRSLEIQLSQVAYNGFSGKSKEALLKRLEKWQNDYVKVPLLFVWFCLERGEFKTAEALNVT